ncbi:Tetrachloroethene reductive dehalogenase TceA [Dehalococcoides mccartyi]|uniref:Tetrachloroethene reductive dehalogenase TceA n=1 Tax=Dehalococcoides mccartyi TaxID=61435 RepID=A0A328ELW9_9CHLR|nr:Tetrachloroethene reductive dehalogenase TceA [Dehalococcoides mccartyi]
MALTLYDAMAKEFPGWTPAMPVWVTSGLPHSAMLPNL